LRNCKPPLNHSLLLEKRREIPSPSPRSSPLKGEEENTFTLTSFLSPQGRGGKYLHPHLVPLPSRERRKIPSPSPHSSPLKGEEGNTFTLTSFLSPQGRGGKYLHPHLVPLPSRERREIPSPSPRSSPLKGEEDFEHPVPSGHPSTRGERESFSKFFPSPLAGEGQDEG